jgi:hypothetical protein
LELKLEVFNVFNRALFILNNGNDVLSFLTLPSLMVPVNANDPNGPKMSNPNYANCNNPNNCGGPNGPLGYLRHGKSVRDLQEAPTG